TGMSCAFPGSVASVQRQAAGLRTPARWATITIKGQHTGPKHGNETSTWHVRGPLLIAYRTQQLGHYAMSVLCRFCCRSPLKASANNDSLTLTRSAAGMGHDGSVGAGSRAAVLFVLP